MFSKSSVFVVVVFAAFVSLGVLLLPQVGQAQCVWDCDLGSDPSFNPWGNSPQSQLDIAYCLDRDCVANLKDKNQNPIFTGNSIPVPLVQQEQDAFPCPGTGDVTISGNVVALLRDNHGNLKPESAARAFLFLNIKDVNCTAINGKTILSRVIQPNTSRTLVFGASSSITILAPTSSTPASLSTPIGWTGCPSNKRTGLLTADCSFPLGIVEFNAAQLQNELPQTLTFNLGEVYRAVESTRFVGVRDCKGDANSTDPGTIACSTGGGESLALFTFPGNWAGAQNHTINPNSGNTPFDIVTPLFNLIVIDDPAQPIMATANDGPQVATTGCFTQDNQQTLRCFFTATDLLPNGCTKNQPVIVLVTGNILGETVGFQSHDNPTCAK